MRKKCHVPRTLRRCKLASSLVDPPRRDMRSRWSCIPNSNILDFCHSERREKFSEFRSGGDPGNVFPRRVQPSQPRGCGGRRALLLRTRGEGIMHLAQRCPHVARLGLINTTVPPQGFLTKQDVLHVLGTHRLSSDTIDWLSQFV